MTTNNQQPNPIEDRRRGVPVPPPSGTIAIAYAIFGIVWIFTGHFLRNWFDDDAPALAADDVEIWKGLLFVTISALFIYVIQRVETTLRSRVSQRLGNAEFELFKGRQRLEEILAGTRAGTWEWKIATGEVTINERWAEIIGYSVNELEPISIQTWTKLTHPDDLAASDAALKRHFAKEIDYYECEARMRHKNGQWVWIADRGKVVEWAPNGEPARMSGTHINIDEQKRNVLRLASMLKMREAVMNCHAELINHQTESALLNKICRILVEKRDYDLVWIGIPENDQERSVSVAAKAGRALAYLDQVQVHWGDDNLGSGPTGTAIRTGSTQVIDDVAVEEKYKPWRSAAEKNGFESSASVPIRAEGYVIAALNVYSRTEKRFDREEIELLDEFASHLGLVIRMKRTEAERDIVTKALGSSSLNIIKAVSATIEKRDPYTAGHQSRVAELAVRIAQKLSWRSDRIEGLRLGAIIHDIGKIYVPAEILNRPGKLTAGEYAVIKTHPEVGAEILSGIKFPWPIQDMIMQHHERIDGSGYPRGLKGAEIIPEAKVLAVADVVEAITSHRPYRPSLGFEIARNELGQRKGTAYEREIVDACLEVLEKDGFRFSSNFGNSSESSGASTS